MSRLTSNNGRIESEQDVRNYIKKLRYALECNASIHMVPNRFVDKDKGIKYTNRYTLADLFPKEDPVSALRRELGTLEVENYIRTLKDNRYPHLSELREFGKRYNGSDVYIKLRVELIGKYGGQDILVLSFHYAEYGFDDSTFPYA